jgi:catechol 2,3-dioxygenase-like lactoylglutathione lyase family enzyme
LAQNAPVTVLNDPGGHHAFEMIDDDAATRDAIDRTIDFVKRATAPAYRAALRRSLGEATAAAAVTTRDFHAAAGAYRDLVAAHPDDIRLRLAYGESLLGDAQYAAACAEFDRLRDKGLGRRDLGLPAAEACLRNGDEDAAIAWLRTIPKQFLPASVQNDPVFAPLRNRPEFRALFDGDDSDATAETPAPLLTVGGAFFALSVADMEASAKWYSEKLGLSVTMRVLRTATPGVTILEGGGLIVELVERADGVPLSTVAPAIKESNRVHGLFKAGFIVDDFDRAVAGLRARGVDIAMGPFPAHDGQRANVIIRDNAGNYLQLFAK